MQTPEHPHHQEWLAGTPNQFEALLWYWASDPEKRVALIAARDAEIRREAATIADGFTCGACGMDGKAGAAIRASAPAGKAAGERPLDDWRKAGKAIAEGFSGGRDTP